MVLYELAYNLRMPVYQLVEEMPYDEFIKWQGYFEKRPVGWREDDRTMKLLQVQGLKKRPEEIFDSLARLKAAINEERKLHDGKVSIRSLKASTLFSKMSGAKGGETPGFMKEI